MTELLRNILQSTLEQNKIIKSNFLLKDYVSALTELENANEKLEELINILSLLETIKTGLSENSQEDTIYN